ncbi:ABC transporter ATP-binding protein [Paenibacillus validus]|uniref:ATP-binding cassette domain-containing protein n=1 Tax=Paenibacillus validus TaxID=44253 RepID=A0A7X2Z8S9_9BACL|nr:MULTISPECIES: ABC transporter ATP-binding protein [Paenibacillus]MED4600982.1 ABC transporter ATP-binding protein [Paenibacillus validus]MED4604971.1 ABC transporter ATP-binding protein [Paenibacillus validus]MUG69758.1 ATP-binding cassette domain-containing protein [Paenibacillus validus]
MITIRNLSKQYKNGEWALQHINLSIENGMFGLLGPNGAGKTTLMRILATLLHPTEGDVLLHGVPLTEPHRVRGMLGYLPQYFQVYPQLTAFEFLDYVGVMKGLDDKRKRKEEIEHLLEKVNLANKGKSKVKTFSGGMKQRLGIAQALLGSPRVLIVDEPTAGLDPEERVRFRNLLTQFSIDRTVLLSTHIVADIETSCRKLAVLNRGEVALTGSVHELGAYAEGSVWELEVSEQEFAAFSPSQIVSTSRTEHGIVCRVVSASCPGLYAAAVKPTLEDGYLALLGGVRHA